MKIGFPTYLKAFQCLAGDCPDTCCIGWEIPVDRECRGRYRLVYQENPDLGGKLKKYLHNGRIRIPGKTCPFLTEEKLCELVLALGEDGIGKTCKRYPRHREDYGELHEIFLLASCPAAARLILAHGMECRMKEMPERDGNMEGIDLRRLEVLFSARAAMFEDLRGALAQGTQEELPGVQEEQPGVRREQPGLRGERQNEAERRMRACLRLARLVQKAVDAGEYEEARQIIAGFQENQKEESLCQKPELRRFLFMSDLMAAFSGFEPVDGHDERGRNWKEVLEETRTDLYHSPDSRDNYGKRRKEFLKGHPEAESFSLRVFEYFLYSFGLTALYDGDFYGKVKMAAACAMTAEDLLLSAGASDLKTQVGVFHLLARQIENSRENLGRLERLMRGRIKNTSNTVQRKNAVIK